MQLEPLKEDNLYTGENPLEFINWPQSVRCSEVSLYTCVFAVVGLYFHRMTEMVATFLSHQNFGYFQLSSSVSPAFKNTSVYPYLFRVVDSSEFLNSAIVAMMIKLNWTKINLVYDLNPFSVRLCDH